MAKNNNDKITTRPFLFNSETTIPVSQNKVNMRVDLFDEDSVNTKFKNSNKLQYLKKRIETNRKKQFKPKGKVSKNILSESNKNVAPKDGFSARNFSYEKLEALIKTIGKYTKKEEMNGRLKGMITFVVSDNANKVTIRYNKGTVQLQGKINDYYNYVKHLLKSNSKDLKDIKPHFKDEKNYDKKHENSEKKSEVNILNTKVTLVEFEEDSLDKELMKYIPDAYNYLSEQAKKDICIGMKDIFNKDILLSDYSGLLIAPYRALERLIFNLQQKYGIEVKMIGQAFEKTDEGYYTLKIGYRNIINSIVYNEVLSALYTEYYNGRNFYTHSDNNEKPRTINDREVLEKKFLTLLNIINYNCKKLNEIKSINVVSNKKNLDDCLTSKF